jgi:hypothetical protein
VLDRFGNLFDRTLADPRFGAGQLPVEYADMGNGRYGIVSAPDARKYTVRTDRAVFGTTSKVTYIGEAKQGSTDIALAWRIRFVQRDVDGNFLGILWANGKATFDNAWTGHAGLPYS